jgi:RNA polymerase-binding transcription factor DksA
VNEVDASLESPVPSSHEVVLSEAEQILDDVDQALIRLEEGTYGTCEACGGPIDDDRLASMPAARTCAQHPLLTDRPA